MKVPAVVLVVAVVLVAEFQICIFRAMAARSSSANAIRSIQLRYRHRVRERAQQPPRAPPRQQPQVQVARLAGVESISTFAFASIVPRSGRRCLTMAGGR